MKLNHLILAIGFLATFDCYAGTIDCLDTINHEFEYHFSASDGGAYLPPSESLVVKGETLIRRSPYDEQEIIKASVDFRDASAKIIKTAISDNKKFQDRH
ncbi:hypothetical protein [Methylocucumis oryzae]|uniref:Uncharacterized protein n=1 Tax=Methylocucumis oryzae TaxID=1632867 RepID=A0A0F3IHH0_9GAMM|nr:hypothetical protein [Methylocucumis oryzae]KJV05993.1 hypothetical protein VZ94_14130 [Methylocucumis oryzae]